MCPSILVLTMPENELFYHALIPGFISISCLHWEEKQLMRQTEGTRNVHKALEPGFTSRDWVRCVRPVLIV